jgi:RNA-directed DNA polymerase
MTMPRYLGCSAGSKVTGIASSPRDNAWIVNLGNGNCNWNGQSNRNHVRPVLAGECQPQVTLRDLHSAWRAARQGKTPSLDQYRFEYRWIDGLLDIQRRLNNHHWFPAAPLCFVEQKPKAREIHAPSFSDRVVHHLVVPQLERIYERVFIHDSFSNRVGKGTHAAVARLRQFIREVRGAGGRGYYLQLDIRNFFVSIHRPTLYAMLKPRMERAGVSEPIRRAVHALLTWPVSRTGVNYACTEAERAAVPAYKRLENAVPGCGIAIGNLSSQFFANVYLDRLDQFVKHKLKVRRYVRYVDDFVLVHESREQLEAWRQAIVEFLRSELRLELKPDHKLQLLERGIDFLGYVAFPTHAVVRRRVIGHCRSKLADWEREHCHAGRIRASKQARNEIRSVWASYVGHFSHASSFKVRLDIYRRFPWLAELSRTN